MFMRESWVNNSQIFSIKSSQLCSQRSENRSSCRSTLLNMVEHFKKSLDNCEYVAWLSMDLSQTFDCLSHCLTSCKLYSYGVSRKACTLIACYLRGRKQLIKLGNTRSEWTELLKGDPQGSKLGPLIFDIFLNDIFYFVSKGDLCNYTDDDCISVSYKDIGVLSKQLQSETQVMAKWFADNSMKANADKYQGIFCPGTIKIQMFMLHWGILKLLSYKKYMFSACVLMENEILMDISAAFVQRLVPKSLLYNIWQG